MSAASVPGWHACSAVTVSAHEAQYAACLCSLAGDKPRPPMRSGKWARRSLSGGRSSGTSPPDSKVARQRSIASSCDAAYDAVALGGTVRSR